MSIVKRFKKNPINPLLALGSFFIAGLSLAAGQMAPAGICLFSGLLNTGLSFLD